MGRKGQSELIQTDLQDRGISVGRAAIWVQHLVQQVHVEFTGADEIKESNIYTCLHRGYGN